VQVQGTKGVIHVPVGAAAAQPFLSAKPYADPNDPAAQWHPIPVEWDKWGQEHNAYTYDLWAQWLANPAARPLAGGGTHPLDAEHGRAALEIIHAAFESHFQGGNRVALPLEHRDHPLERRWKRIEGHR
jgi:predicted dehydrogenase